MARLEVRNIVKAYRRRTVVKSVSFHVNSAEIVGLLGPNGAGKSTSFRIAIGMVRPLSGLVFLNGKDVTTLPMHKRARRGLGYLAQEPAIFRKLSVEQNINAVLELRGLPNDEIRYRTEMLLEEFNLTGLRTQRAATLSGGERRRLEISRSLATQPTIMLLDEPIYGVDPLGVREIVELVVALKERGIGILLTEHNVAQVLPLLDRAYVIHDGVVIFHGTPEELVADAAVREHFLGMDFSLAGASDVTRGAAAPRSGRRRRGSSLRGQAMPAADRSTPAPLAAAVTLPTLPGEVAAGAGVPASATPAPGDAAPAVAEHDGAIGGADAASDSATVARQAAIARAYAAREVGQGSPAPESDAGDTAAQLRAERTGTAERVPPAPRDRASGTTAASPLPSHASRRRAGTSRIVPERALGTHDKPARRATTGRLPPERDRVAPPSRRRPPISQAPSATPEPPLDSAAQAAMNEELIERFAEASTDVIADPLPIPQMPLKPDAAAELVARFEQATTDVIATPLPADQAAAAADTLPDAGLDDPIARPKTGGMPPTTARPAVVDDPIVSRSTTVPLDDERIPSPSAGAAPDSERRPPPDGPSAR